MARLGTAVGVSFILAAIIVGAGCGSNGDESAFPGGQGSSGDNGNGDNSGGGFGSSGSNGATPPPPPCVGLQCQQVACPNGGTTSLSGKVYDPSGTVPLYNAVVYVPNEAVAPFAEGITCDKCGTTPSGKPVTTAITDAHGAFTLKNVPVGVEVPLVVQVGRWRRQVKIPAAGVTKCGDAAVDAGLTRLPRNKSEGDIPKIAIATGGADSLECFLRKIGIDDAEITNSNGTGRVHLFQGKRSNNDGSRIDNKTTSAQSLWDDGAALKKYDMVILSCEGDENNGTKGTTARDNLLSYLDSGGRVFASHFHYTWFKNGSGQLPQTASWVGNGDAPDQNVTVDQSFAKGKAFAEWLQDPVVRATTTMGSMPMSQLRRNVTTVPGSGMGPDVSRRWLYATPGGAEETKFYSFNTPIGVTPENQCGRGVYTDIHVSSGPNTDQSGGTFPNNCKSPKPALTPQEKALLFLLFDLASCIQDDNQAPTAPPVSVVK